MVLKIHSGTTIGELNAVFSRTFPFLKLELFSSRTSEAGGPLLLPYGDPEFSVGYIHIRPTDTAEAVERRFLLGFGLPVQVLRRSDEDWLEAARKERCSLQELSDRSRLASRALGFNLHTLFF